MKLSLTLKLTLAFLFVSIIGVVLTAVFVRQRAGSEFDRFVLDRYQLDLLDDLAQHYRQSGSWGRHQRHHCPDAASIWPRT
jgi:hypothetical protein